MLREIGSSRNTKLHHALLFSIEGCLQSFLKSLRCFLCGKHLLFLVTHDSVLWKFPPVFILLSPCLPFPLSLAPLCGTIGQCSVMVQSAIKSLLGEETPTDCCLMLENRAIKPLTQLPPCRHSYQQYWLWIFNIPSCVKDLQHSQQHAWKGKTGGQACYNMPAFKYLKLSKCHFLWPLFFFISRITSEPVQPSLKS